MTAHGAAVKAAKSDMWEVKTYISDGDQQAKVIPRRVWWSYESELICRTAVGVFLVEGGITLFFRFDEKRGKLWEATVKVDNSRGLTATEDRFSVKNSVHTEYHVGWGLEMEINYETNSIFHVHNSHTGPFCLDLFFLLFIVYVLRYQ